jgi:hypothetical protein
MAKSDSERSKQYAKSEKGKEAEARKQARKKAERKAAKMLREGRDTRRQAKFSKRYTVYNTAEVKQADKLNTGVNDVMNELSLKGVTVAGIRRHYAQTIFHTDKHDDLITTIKSYDEPQCVQAGVSRWSESILNPTYRKKHNLTAPKLFIELVEDVAYELSLEELRALVEELHKLLDGGRKSQTQKPR